MSKELDVAIEASKEAGKILMKYYGKVDIKYKPDRSIATKADIESEKTIKSILMKEFSSYSFLGEETGYDKRHSEYMWIIDPLDGTTNYSMKNPFFDVSIALAYKKDPILGVVCYPYEGGVFYSENGKGAYSNDKPITPSGVDKVEDSILTFCHGRDRSSVKSMIKIFEELKLINNKVRQIGAAALELCYVACGRVESFVMVGVNSWDVAAGAIIVEEAGGTVSDFDGRPFDINSRTILASNGKIHTQLLKLIQKAMIQKK